MKKNMLLTALMLLGTVFFTGCASMLTLMSPYRTEVVVEKTWAGAFAGYDYRYQVDGNQLALLRTRLCTETAKAHQVTEKKEIGYGPALLEMPLYGLGLVDILNAYAISEWSRKVTPLEDYPTGNLIPCGKEEPAAHEPLIVENREKGIYKTGLTDQNGILDLDNLLKNTPGPVALKVRLAKDTETDKAFCFTYPGNRRLAKGCLQNTAAF